MTRRSKRTDATLSGRDKHRVLIFGERTCGSKTTPITHDLCSVEIIRFPSDYDQMKDLSGYNLVILDYSAFLREQHGVVSSVYEKEQEVFEKQMLHAAGSGTSFCIVHYDEDVPREDPYSGAGRMNEDDVKECRRLQIGFRWLEKFSIKAVRLDSPILLSNTVRNEFQAYVDRWGTSKLAFRPYGDGALSDVIVGLTDDYTSGFALDFGRGKLIYLPCQRDFSRPRNTRDLFNRLIDSVTTYLTRTRTDLPPWARTPLFPEEEELARKKVDRERELAECEDELRTFHDAKRLLLKSEYGLEDAVPRFLREECAIPTERQETYKEDFWILDAHGEREAICEVKSYVKGLKKSGLFSIYNHRESYRLSEDFPALLFVNAHLNAASWQQKDRPIDKEHYRWAADNHVLIVRIEDLVLAWDWLRKGGISSSELVTVFTDSVGWLRFCRDGSWVMVN